MKNKIINKLFGKDLVQAMREILEEFINLDYDVDLMVKALRDINESVRIGIYLMALEKNYDAVAYKIKKANEQLNEIRKDKFLEAYKNKETDRFLAVLGKSDKLSLLGDLGIDGDVKARANLSKEQKDYYKIISNSIMESQKDDKRDGIDKFITYKKEV